MYRDRYFNLFSKRLRQSHTPLTRQRDYLMRFNTILPYSFARNQDAFSIVYSNSPSVMNLSAKGQSSALKKDHFTIINPATDWEFYCREDERIDVLSFLLSQNIMSKFNFYITSGETELLDDPSGSIQYDAFFLENTYRADYTSSGKFLKTLFEKSNTPYYELLSPEEIVFEFLTVLYQEQKGFNEKIGRIEKKKPSTRQEVFKRVMIAFEYIHDHYEYTNIGINDLEKACGLSGYHLCRAFKATFHMTPHQYINSLRMTKAREYIKRGTMTLSEISHTLMFPDLSSFSKLFKKTYGVSPSGLLSPPGRK